MPLNRNKKAILESHTALTPLPTTIDDISILKAILSSAKQQWQTLGKYWKRFESKLLQYSGVDNGSSKGAFMAAVSGLHSLIARHRTR